MGHTKIRVFRGTRDGKEDPNEFLEDIEWAYEQEFKGREPAAVPSLGAAVDPQAAFANKTHRILFRQHLEDDALQWYSDLDADLKQDWVQLKKAFLPAFAITTKDAQTKRFELRVKLANLEQLPNESIAEYLKRADELAIRLPQDTMDLGMAILRGMRDTSKRERVSFECEKDMDYNYSTVTRLVKAAYNEVGKPNPFNPGYKDALSLTLPKSTRESTEELMRQTLINTNQAFPALVQGMRALHTAQLKAMAGRNPPNRVVEKDSNDQRPMRDVSEVECFICHEFGHYASTCPQRKPPAVTARAILTRDSQNENEKDDGGPSVPACCLMVEERHPAMAASGDKGKEKILTKSSGITKRTRKGPTDYNPPMLPKHIMDQIEEFNKAQGVQSQYTLVDDGADEEMIDDREVEEIITPAPKPTKAADRTRPPQTRVTKTGKVQELVATKGPKMPDPIRGMMGQDGFNIRKILDLPVEISVGELLSRSDSTIKELAYNMQRATPRYRVRKPATKATPNATEAQNPSGAVLSAAAVTPPPVTAHAYDDDGKSKPVLITSWIGTTKLPRTLLDGGSVVELISEKLVKSIKPRPIVYTDGYLRVSLATDKLDELTDYVFVPVNVQGVQAMVKAWIVQVNIYDLLLGLSWLRRVHCKPDYGSGEIFISGDDHRPRRVPAELIAMESGLPIVEFEEDDEESADRACQELLDDQENVMP